MEVCDCEQSNVRYLAIFPNASMAPTKSAASVANWNSSQKAHPHYYVHAVFPRIHEFVVYIHHTSEQTNKSVSGSKMYTTVKFSLLSLFLNQL